MFEVAWREVTTAGRIVLKRKSFATEAARDRFIDRLFTKDNFLELYGVR